MTIPRIIHYCWFGGKPLPELAVRCIESWKKYCPDYEIKEWNESNFDIHMNAYVEEAYRAKKWAFVSDVARLYALVTFGGIYLDTDVELLKPIDCFLKYRAFGGFESVDKISTAIMACEYDFPLFKECLQEYKGRHFFKTNGDIDYTTNVLMITEKYLKYGLRLDNTHQVIHELEIFPTDFFCPKDYNTLKTCITDNTYAIHHFDGSWQNEEQKYIEQKLRDNGVLGKRCLKCYMIVFFAKVRYNGLMSALKTLLRWISMKIKR